MKPARRLGRDLAQIRFPLLLILLYSGIVFPLFHCFCPMVILFGYPCPACGLTRAGIALFTGSFHRAMELNAMILLWLPYLLWIMVHRYILGHKIPFLRPVTCVTGIATLIYYVLRIANGAPVEVLYPGLIAGFHYGI